MPIALNKRLNSNSTLLNINVNKWKSHLNNKSANRKLKSIPEVEDDTVLLNSEAELPLLIPLLGSSSSISDDDAKTLNMHKESKPSRKKVFEMNKVKNGIEAIFPACGKAKFNKLEENVLIDFGNDLEVEREQLYGLCSFPRNGAEERKRPPDYNLMEIPRPKFVKEPRDDSSRRITKSHKEDTYRESKPGYSSASVSNNLEQPLSLAKICSNSSEVLKLDNSAQERMTNLRSYRSRVEVNSQLKKTLVSEVNDQHARNSPISKMDISPQVAKSNTIYELEKAREKLQNGPTSVANISELIQSPMTNTFANMDFSTKIEEKPKRKFGQVSAELVRLQPTSSLSMLSREWPMTYETCNKLRSVVKVEDNCIDAPIWSRKSRAMPSTYYTRRREQLKLEAGGLGNSLTLPSYYRRVTTGSQNLIRSKSADEAETKSILRIFVGPDLNGNLSNARQSDSKAPSTSNPSSFTPTNLTSSQSFVDNRETFTKETPNVRQFVRRIERSPSPLAEKIRAKSQPLPLLIRKKSAATNSEGTIFNKGNTKQNRESETVSTTSVEVELFREQSINVSASCTVPHKDYSTPRSRSSGPVATRRKQIPFARMPSLPSSPPPPVITGSSHQFRVVEINLDDASEPAPRSLHTPPKSFDTGLPLLNRRLRSTSAHGIISNTRNPAFPRSSSSTPSSNAANQNLPNSARSQGTTLYQQFKQNKFANGAFSRPINSEGNLASKESARLLYSSSKKPVESQQQKLPLSYSSNSSSSPPLPLSSGSLFNTSNNSSSGVGSSVSPSLSTISAKSGRSSSGGCTEEHDSIPNISTGSFSMASEKQQQSLNSSRPTSILSPTGSSSSDYRVVAMDERPDPGKLDDFIPEVERNPPSPTSARSASTGFYTWRQRELKSADGGYVRPDSQTQLIRNYALHADNDSLQIKDANGNHAETLEEQQNERIAVSPEIDVQFLSYNYSELGQHPFDYSTKKEASLPNKEESGEFLSQETETKGLPEEERNQRSSSSSLGSEACESETVTTQSGEYILEERPHSRSSEIFSKREKQPFVWESVDLGDNITGKPHRVDFLKFEDQQEERFDNRQSPTPEGLETILEVPDEVLNVQIEEKQDVSPVLDKNYDGVHEPHERRLSYPTIGQARFRQIKDQIERKTRSEAPGTPPHRRKWDLDKELNQLHILYRQKELGEEENSPVKEVKTIREDKKYGDKWTEIQVLVDVHTPPDSKQISFQHESEIPIIMESLTPKSDFPIPIKVHREEASRPTPVPRTRIRQPAVNTGSHRPRPLGGLWPEIRRDDNTGPVKIREEYTRFVKEEEVRISETSYKFYDKNGTEIGGCWGHLGGGLGKGVAVAVEGGQEIDLLSPDTREWRQFIAEQRLPNPGISSSRNRIDADSKFRIIHPHSRDYPAVNDRPKWLSQDQTNVTRPIIQTMDRPATNGLSKFHNEEFSTNGGYFSLGSANRRPTTSQPDGYQMRPYEQSNNTDNPPQTQQRVQWSDRKAENEAQSKDKKAFPEKSARIESKTPAGQKIDRNNDEEKQIMTVSGRHRCSHCGIELGRGAAMIVESLNLFYHLSCFRCFVCNMPLGSGQRGADVRVRGSKLHCQKCYFTEERITGVKMSQI
ncbi:LIM domain-containing protein [Ditylenchus destructor]|nr:LIM domain-containing protein [Ditylenchus destructor]